MSTMANKTLWVDLDNTPHVMFFEPIFKELERRGYRMLITARRAFQVCELADEKGIKYIEAGRHNGKNKLIKFIGLYYRALQLLPIARKNKPALAISHGSRSQIIVCNLLGIPSVLIADYEFSKTLPTMRPTWEFVPEVIPGDSLACAKEHIRTYPGIKEDVYVPFFKPDPAIIHELGLQMEKVIVTVRPPATEAHYHNPEAEILFDRFMERIHKTDMVQVILLPRNKKQEDEIAAKHPDWFKGRKVIIPKRAINGLDLIWHSDLVVSGGGTMNREAAALGVPVYSIFRGPTGAVDKHLTNTGRLMMIKHPEEVDTHISIQKRSRKSIQENSQSLAMDTILQNIENILSDGSR